MSRELKVALIGSTQDTKDDRLYHYDWKSTFPSRLSDFFDYNYMHMELKLVVLESTPPEKAKNFPSSSFPYLRHIRFAQEQSIASRADVVVVVNEGNFVKGDEGVKAHWDRLARRSSCLVFWTPPEIDESMPSEESIAKHPHVVPYYGTLKNLVPLVAYLLLPSEDFFE